MSSFPTIDALLNNASSEIDSANSSIINSFPPYDTDVYNNLQIATADVPPTRIIVPPPVVPVEPITFVNKKTPFTNIEANGISDPSSNFWFKGLKADLDWDNIKEEDIVLNYDLNNYITPYTPAISGIWRPAIMYVDPFSGSKNTSITYSDSGIEETCEAGLGLENFITISSPVFKTWEVDPGLSAVIDWVLPDIGLGVCGVIGVLFWYRHYDVTRETDIKASFTISDVSQSKSITQTSLSEQSVRIDGKIIKLKAQHDDRIYSNPEDDKAEIALYGLHSGLKEGNYVSVTRVGSNGSTEEIYRVTSGLWVCLGPKRFIQGVDIYLPNSFFTINYENSYLVKVLKGEIPNEKPEPLFEYYPKTNLITTDLAKYRGCLTSLFNLSNNTTLEKLLDTGEIGEADLEENKPRHIFINKEKRNEYIGLKNLARFLSTGPLVDMASIYAYNSFLTTLDLAEYRQGDFMALKTRLEDVYGRLQSALTEPIVTPITSRVYDLPPGILVSDKPIIKLNDSIVEDTMWEKITETQIKFSDALEFLPENNLISVQKEIWYTEDDTSSSFLKSNSRSLYNKIEDNDTWSIEDNLRIIKTKKDLALALTVFDNVSKNFYLRFNPGQSLKMLSKKTTTVPQAYVKLDFEHKRRLGVQTREFWYKQRINFGGTEVYTKLKVPDDSEFSPGENESIVISITDQNFTSVKDIKVPIFDFVGFDLKKADMENSTLTSMYDAFGVNQQFYKTIELQKTLNQSLRDPSETYNLGLIDGQPYRITKRLYDWTWGFDSAIRDKQRLIEDLNKNNDVFRGSLALLEDRFLEANATSKSVYPDIKEVYFHRLGGVLFPKLFLWTIGKNIYWNYRTGPTTIQDAQYFIENPPTNITRANKALIEFECNDALQVRLYDVEIENLRINTYESAGYRPFPNKVPIRSDETRVYDQIIGYEFNEDSHLLTTQFSPPIIAYGGHRKEDIDAIGVSILNHPKPIEKNTTTGLYDILAENTLPFTAKNSKYTTTNTRERTEAGFLRDKSSVKCFLTPQYFYNEIVFRKGFFHPNKGWIDYSHLPNPALRSKTPVITSGVSNCRTYGSYGKRFFPELLTKALADKNKECKTTDLTGSNELLILDPIKEYNVDALKLHRVFPNIITTNVDNDINFISFISAKLSFLNHAFPKDLRIALFDPREYRFIGGNIVDKTIAYDLHLRQCQEPPPESEIKKLLELRTKENNSWIGPLKFQPRLETRHLLFNTTLLNYKPNFSLTFNNYGRDLKYAADHDLVLPEDSFDYYIGSSGIIRGFGEFSTDAEAVSSESDNTWGINISDMGGLDTGSTCFQLQVCTGCPVPNHDTLSGATGIAITPYNLLNYNAETFDSINAYENGYCFIADFTDTKHLIPPINLEAPYNSQVTQRGDFPCEDQPDPPRPREFVKPVPVPEPVFIPPIHFPLVGLLTHISIMNQMMAMGYDMPYGAFGGVWTPNPFTDNVSLKAKHRAYLEGKGYLQVEGTTGSYLRGLGFYRGLTLARKYQYGIPNKVEIDIKYKNCLWYTIEADIFKYTEQCSPVLENTKFKYNVYDKYENYPGFDYSFRPQKDARNREYLLVDGARAFYSFTLGETVELDCAILRQVMRNNQKFMEPTGIKITTSIADIIVPPLTNPQYVPSIIDNSFYNENNGLDSNAPVSITDRDRDNQKIPGNTTHIYLSTGNLLEPTDVFMSGTILKPSDSNKNSMLLYNSTIATHDRLIPFGKWRNSDNQNLGDIVSSYIKDQLFSEGSYGWGSDKNNPLTHPTIKTPDLLGLHNFDYHFGKADYCGRLKIVNNNGAAKTIRIPYNPRLKYENMAHNPHAQRVQNEYIRYTGYPTHIKDIPNRIYAHNIFSFSDSNRNLFNISTGGSKYEQYYYDKLLAKYYLPYYDLTLDTGLLGNFLDNDVPSNYTIIPAGQSLPNPGRIGVYYKFSNTDTIYRWNDKKRLYEDVSKLELKDKDYQTETESDLKGTIQFEHIFSKINGGPNLEALPSTMLSPGNISTGGESSSSTSVLSYNDNYYWISIPADASGVLASTSKIPYSIKQDCDYLGAGWASRNCQNVCNTEMRGPMNPEDANSGSVGTSQQLSMFYLDAANNQCPQVNYELRETTQSFYMGCGESKNDSQVRLDLIFRYLIPEEAHAFVSARELLENNNEIRVRFKYIPRKIQTDFTINLGQNAVNQSQLYFWECHETNVKNLYTERTRINKTPPFYQVLNEMIFRAWFGERQKISTQDTFGVDTFITQNHYKWVPYEYDDTEIFKAERES